MMHLDIDTAEDAQELVFILFMRKFHAHDHLAQMSTIVNDCIAECVEAYPQIADNFDGFRARAADAFEAACALPQDGGQGLWEYLVEQQNDAARDIAVAQFFAPLKPRVRPNYSDPKEVSDAYRA